MACPRTRGTDVSCGGRASLISDADRWLKRQCGDVFVTAVDSDEQVAGAEMTALSCEYPMEKDLLQCQVHFQDQLHHLIGHAGRL